MLVDYHMHVTTDMWGNHKPEEYIEVAKKKSLDEIGFSDHFHVGVEDDVDGVLDYSMKYEDLPNYAKKTLMLKKIAGIELKFGIEMDFVPGREDEIRKIPETYPFDYVIGSVHFMGKFNIGDPVAIPEYKKWDIFKLYKLYFNLVQKSAASGLFDIIAHADLIKIFNFKPREDITDVLKSTIEVLKENKVCVEINTSGLNKPCKEAYPSEDFLKICFDAGVPVTLGSDAHHPGHVAQHFDKAILLIKKIGYEKIATFEKRKMKLVELSDWNG